MKKERPVNREVLSVEKKDETIENNNESQEKLRKQVEFIEDVITDWGREYSASNGREGIDEESSKVLEGLFSNTKNELNNQDNKDNFGNILKSKIEEKIKDGTLPENFNKEFWERVRFEVELRKAKSEGKEKEFTELGEDEKQVQEYVDKFLMWGANTYGEDILKDGGRLDEFLKPENITFATPVINWRGEKEPFVNDLISGGSIATIISKRINHFNDFAKNILSRTEGDYSKALEKDDHESRLIEGALALAKWYKDEMEKNKRWKPSKRDIKNRTELAEVMEGLNDFFDEKRPIKKKEVRDNKGSNTAIEEPPKTNDDKTSEEKPKPAEKEIDIKIKENRNYSDIASNIVDDILSEIEESPVKKVPEKKEVKFNKEEELKRREIERKETRWPKIKRSISIKEPQEVPNLKEKYPLNRKGESLAEEVNIVNEVIDEMRDEFEDEYDRFLRGERDDMPYWPELSIDMDVYRPSTWRGRQGFIKPILDAFDNLTSDGGPETKKLFQRFRKKIFKKINNRNRNNENKIEI